MTRPARAAAQAVLRALTGLRRHPAASGVAVTTVAVAFFLVGLVYTMDRALGAATASWERAHMVLYLEDGVLPDRAGDIRAALEALPAVVRAEYVAPEQALARLRSGLGERDGRVTELLYGVEADALPASIEVTLRAQTRDVAALAPVIERLRAMGGIDEVEFDDDWVDEMSAMRANLHRIAQVASLLVLVLGLYLVTTALGARVGPRVAEASIARLFGASSAFVRAPLIVEGAIQGALGAGLAVLCLWLFTDHAQGGAGAAFGAAVARAMTLPAADHIAAFIGAGAGLGMAGTWLATRRHGFA